MEFEAAATKRCLMRYVHTYVCTYECAEVRNGLLELPPIYNLYLCVDVCVHVGTPEGRLRTDIPLRTPVVPCTPEDFGSSCYVYVNMYVIASKGCWEDCGTRI